MKIKKRFWLNIIPLARDLYKECDIAYDLVHFVKKR